MIKRIIYTLLFLIAFALAGKNAVCNGNFGKIGNLHCYLTINQADFILGDTLRFNAFFSGVEVTKKDFMVDANFVDAGGKLVSRKKFMVREKQCAGFFLIKPGLVGGKYGLSIQLPDSNGSIKLAEISLFVLDPRQSVEEILKTPGIKIHSDKNWEARYQTNLLVRDLPSVLGVSLMAENGMGIEANGVLIDSLLKDTLQFFKTNSYGFGMVHFTPKTDKNYFLAVKQGNGDTIKFAIPNANQKNFNVSLEEKENGFLFHAYSKDTTLGRGCNFTIKNNLNFIRNYPVNWQKGHGEIFIDFKDLPQGIGKVHLSSQGELFGAPLYFYNSEFEPELLVTTDKTIYKPRETVRLNLEVRDKLKQPVKGNLLVKVSRKSIFESPCSCTSGNNQDYQCILQQGILSKDFKGVHAFLQFKGENVFAEEKNTTPISFSGEHSMQFKGLVTNGNQELVVLYLPEDDTVQIIRMEEKGRFSFNLEPFYYNKKAVILNPNLFMSNNVNLLDSSYSAAIVNPLNQVQPADFVFYDSTLVTTYLSDYLRGQVLYSIYRQRKETVLEKNVSSLSNVYDFRFKLEDYNKMEDMFSIIRELVIYTFIRKTKNGYRIRLYSKDFGKNYLEEPLYIVDNVPILNNEIILNINPEIIETIDVVNSFKNLKKFGLLGKNGILRINTKDGNYLKHEIKGVVPVVLNGLNINDLKVEERSPNSAKNLLDLRACLYWNPYITVDQGGSATRDFLLSDETGVFEIKVVGITESGEQVKSVKTIEVQLPF